MEGANVVRTEISLREKVIGQYGIILADSLWILRKSIHSDSNKEWFSSRTSVILPVFCSYRHTDTDIFIQKTVKFDA